jgi:hypothetical protein
VELEKRYHFVAIVPYHQMIHMLLNEIFSVEFIRCQGEGNCLESGISTVCETVETPIFSSETKGVGEDE